jgi:hypothetical protein
MAMIPVPMKRFHTYLNLIPFQGSYLKPELFPPPPMPKHIVKIGNKIV